MSKREPYARVLSSGCVLDCVEAWVGRSGLVFRECGGLPDSHNRNGGRVDALIVPTSREFPCVKQRRCWFWDRFGLVGVEVKVTRGDFLQGLRSQQYERYASALTGLYIATPRGICKKSEIPEGVGHLVAGGHRGKYGSVAICRRHPKWQRREVPSDYLWRLMLRMADEYRQKLGEEWYRREEFERRAGERLGWELHKAIRAIVRDVEVSVERR